MLSNGGVNLMKQYNLSFFNCKRGRVLNGHGQTVQHVAPGFT